MTEEELIARAADERNAIVQRYELGRQPGAKIDSWEDAAFEVYHVLDRYGFIQYVCNFIFVSSVSCEFM